LGLPSQRADSGAQFAGGLIGPVCFLLRHIEALMPLARIITDVADDSLELTMQLRARGFQVETVAPGEVPPTPADLEVRLEECAPEDMLTQAAQTSDADDLWVYVAPGALDDRARPIQTFPLIQRPLPSRVLPISVRPGAGVAKTEAAVILGSLAIDAQEEDLILAELREFRLPVVRSEPSEVPPAPVESRSRQIDPRALSEAIPEKARLAVEVTTPASVKKRVGEKDTAPTLGASASAPHRRAEVSALRIAPAPVPRTVIGSPSIMMPTRKPSGSWNLLPLKIACGAAVLVMSAWLLVDTLRPDAAPPSPQSAAILLQIAPSPAVSQPLAADSVRPAKAVVSTAPSTVRTDAVVSAKPPVSHVPAAAQSARKTAPKVTHSKGDGLIAEDTVVFYDRKPNPSHAKAQAQAESGAKRYSDRN
jgi:hypothetical protein